MVGWWWWMIGFGENKWMVVLVIVVDIRSFYFRGGSGWGSRFKINYFLVIKDELFFKSKFYFVLLHCFFFNKIKLYIHLMLVRLEK